MSEFGFSPKNILILFIYTFVSVLGVTQITDLESRSDTYFKWQAYFWVQSTNTGADLHTSCSGIPILGGYGISGDLYKTYTGISGHNIIYFTMTFYAIDNWGLLNTDKVTISFDTQNFVLSSLLSYAKGVDLCGDSTQWDLGRFKIKGKALHTAPTLTLKFTNGLSSSAYVESFGFRDIQLNFGYKSPGETNEICGFAQDALGTSNFDCNCTQQEYGPSGTCSTCDNSCSSCYAGTSSDCYGCAPGYYWDGTQCTNCGGSCSTCTQNPTTCLSCNGVNNATYVMRDNTCTGSCNLPLNTVTDSGTLYCVSTCSPSQYLLWDGYCYPTCSSPLTIVTLLGDQYCTYPCNPGEYLYKNGTCLTYCNGAFEIREQGGEKFCDWPCNGTDFYYGNGSCISTCTGLFSPFIKGFERYCNFRCISSDFYMSNGTCVSNCIDPFQIVSVSIIENYCEFICPTTSFLYDNGTCMSTCTTPFFPISFALEKYCRFSCSSTTYRYSNGSCIGTCVSPFYEDSKSSIENYCLFECASGEYRYANGSCSTSCTSPFSTRTQGVESYCLFKCIPTDYLLSNNTCLSACPASFDIQMVSTIENYCLFQCASPNYWYANGTCLATCNSPFNAVVAGVERYCYFPCASNQMRRTNGSCFTTCPPAFNILSLSTVENYCINPCGSNFAYENGSCLATCNTPFTSQIYGTEKFCFFQCSASQYLYTNNTCINSCSGVLSPITFSTVENYCVLTCGANFYYQNGTCKSTCTSPFVQFTQLTEKYCNFPCSNTQGLLSNGTCIACSGAFQPISVSSVETYCSFMCQSPDYYYANGTCITGCSYPYTTSIIGLERYCNFNCSATTYLVVNGSCLNSCPSSFNIYSKSNIENYCFFKCSSGNFYFLNGSCISTCPTNRNYTQYVYGVESYCLFKCNPGDYLYSNGTCKSTCPSPFIRTNINSLENYCNFPCPSNTYYYSNGSCLATCSSPFTTLVQGVERYCNYPCAIGRYKFSNNSCLTNCSSPFIAAGVDYLSCTHPCPTANYFYYTNGSCLRNCTAPLINNTLDYLCTFACPPGYFQYPNGTCIASCVSPWNQRINGMEQYCEIPCGLNLYLLPNGSCSDGCPYPMKQAYIQYLQCVPPCIPTTDFYYPETDTCSSLCIRPKTKNYTRDYPICNKASIVPDDIQSMATVTEVFTQVVPKVSAIGVLLAMQTGIGAASPIILVILCKYLYYARYIGVEFPDGMNLYFSQFGTIPSLGINFDTPEFDDQFVDQANVKSPFSDYGYRANFISNFWSNWLSLMIIAGLTMLIIIGNILLKKKKKYATEGLLYLFERLNSLFIWNLILFYFCSVFSNLFLAAFVGFQSSATFSSTMIAAGLAFSIIFMAMAGGLLVLLFRATKKIVSSKNAIIPEGKENVKTTKEIRKQYTYLNFLFKDFKEKSFLSLGFLGFFLVREIFFDIVLAFFSGAPVLQCILIIIPGALFITLIVIKKPFLDNSNSIKFVVLEALLILIYICVLVCGLGLDKDSKDILGTVLTALFITFSAVAMFFLVFTFVVNYHQFRLISKEMQAMGTYSFGDAWDKYMEVPAHEHMNDVLRRIRHFFKISLKDVEAEHNPKVKEGKESKVSSRVSSKNQLSKNNLDDQDSEEEKPKSDDNIKSDTKIKSQDNLKLKKEEETPQNTANLLVSKFHPTTGTDSRTGTASGQRVKGLDIPSSMQHTEPKNTITSSRNLLISTRPNDTEAPDDADESSKLRNETPSTKKPLAAQRIATNESQHEDITKEFLSHLNPYHHVDVGSRPGSTMPKKPEPMSARDSMNSSAYSSKFNYGKSSGMKPADDSGAQSERNKMNQSVDSPNLINLKKGHNFQIKNSQPDDLKKYSNQLY